ncbi:hypothetical protein FKM82_015704 [Ascaphus truei]
MIFPSFPIFPNVPHDLPIVPPASSRSPHSALTSSPPLHPHITSPTMHLTSLSTPATSPSLSTPLALTHTRLNLPDSQIQSHMKLPPSLSPQDHRTLTRNQTGTAKKTLKNKRGLFMHLHHSPPPLPPYITPSPRLHRPQHHSPPCTSKTHPICTPAIQDPPPSAPPNDPPALHIQRTTLHLQIGPPPAPCPPGHPLHYQNDPPPGTANTPHAPPITPLHLHNTPLAPQSPTLALQSKSHPPPLHLPLNHPPCTPSHIPPPPAPPSPPLHLQYAPLTSNDPPAPPVTPPAPQ